MELDSTLHKVQNILKSEQRSGIGDLSTIKADNEEIIKRVITSLKCVISMNQYAAVSEDHLNLNKKLFIILFLNTDTEVYNGLKKNRKYAHLVGFFPKLSQDLFMKIVRELNLQQHLYEAVAQFCPLLAFRVVNMCLDSLNWQDLFESVSFVENIIISLFQKMVYLDYSNKYNLPLKDAFQRMLLHYDAEKSGCIKRMNLWTSGKLKHYAGLIMASLLSVLEKCTNIYFNQQNYIKNTQDVYIIEIDEDSVSVDPHISNACRLLSVDQCYEHIVAKCYENVCSITVDIWLFWVEIDLDEIPDTENTLQRHIGERAYCCIEALNNAERKGVSLKADSSNLILKLESLALKPRCDDDNADSLTLPEILSNIQDTNKDSRKWIQFLVGVPSFATDPSALKIILDHIPFLEELYLKKLWSELMIFIKNNEDCSIQKQFLLDMVDKIDVDLQMKLSECFIDCFGLTTSVLKTSTFQSELTEIFNKVVNEEGKEKEISSKFVKLALQSPEPVLTRIVMEGLTSEIRGHLMADILEDLPAFCDAHYNFMALIAATMDKLLNSLHTLPCSHQTNFPLFVRELVMREILDGKDFIHDCLMKKIDANMKAPIWPVMTACLETLSELYDIKCISSCLDSLEMMLNVIQACRWTPGTFSMAAVRVCELAMQLADGFYSKWNIKSEKEHVVERLIKLLQQTISPINRYHMFRLLSEEPPPTDPALLLVYRMHYGIGEWSILDTTPRERQKIVHGLCFVLPIFTTQEWQELFCVVAPKCKEFQCLFHIVSDALLVSIDIAKCGGSSEVMNCLSFAVLNLAQVVKVESNRWNDTDNEYRVSVLKKMCQLVTAFPSSEIEGVGLQLAKVLQHLLPKGSRRHPLSSEMSNSVTACLARLHPRLRQSLSRHFLEVLC